MGVSVTVVVVLLYTQYSQGNTSSSCLLLTKQSEGGLVGQIPGPATCRRRPTLGGLKADIIEVDANEIVTAVTVDDKAHRMT